MYLQNGRGRSVSARYLILHIVVGDAEFWSHAGFTGRILRLKDGDVIVRINSDAVNSLKEFSDTLKSLTAGSKITITFLRNNEEMTVEAEVKAK